MSDTCPITFSCDADIEEIRLQFEKLKQARQMDRESTAKVTENIASMQTMLEDVREMMSHLDHQVEDLVVQINNSQNETEEMLAHWEHTKLEIDEVMCRQMDYANQEGFTNEHMHEISRNAEEIKRQQQIMNNLRRENETQLDEMRRQEIRIQEMRINEMNYEAMRHEAMRRENFANEEARHRNMMQSMRQEEGRLDQLRSQFDH